jgi:osmotically-inducible protein OsmY
MAHSHLQLALLAAAAAVTAASAQPGSSVPAQQQPAAPPVERERVNVSDAQLGLEVQARIYQELGISNLSTIVSFGVATLNGIVQSEEDRKRAEDLALAIRGVDTVVNELRIADPAIVRLAAESQALAQRERTGLENEIAAALRSDATLGSRSIAVDADEATNTVTLTGTVSTEEEKERAGRLAVGAFPSGQVRNQLEVRQRL